MDGKNKDKDKEIISKPCYILLHDKLKNESQSDEIDQIIESPVPPIAPFPAVSRR